MPNAKPSSARSHELDWSQDSEVEGPRHAQQRNDIRNIQSVRPITDIESAS